ncbi:hypothetical protein [Nocardia pseudobrasiliensis]|uniref:Uridine kinase n=1 Tax=Nocardia pseudobrasiliensis TaxID=45979 RepID=A0A370IBQ7_9NOCA|nr:hypothetical protein [Nocardia pseudobrasiliensis]RDI67541.1 hypothetical protein DFR76_103612 [Nocardia pseudobrasiliensis]
MPAFTPVTVAALVDDLTDRILALSGRAIVAIDGADAADPLTFAHTLTDRIRTHGRPAAVVSLHDYIRPASLRLEYGRDEMSYRTAWFDYPALDREVLQSLRTHAHWLPALWNESTDRSARAPITPAEPNLILIIAGPMLLGRNLNFDLSVELRLSEGALRRRTAPADAFTIDAILHHRERHEDPDLLVAWDHRDRPAVRR